MDFIATGVLWFSIGGVIALLLVALLLIRHRIIGLLLKNPNYAEKHREKYFRMNSNEIILRSKIPPGGNGECILKGDTFILKPDKKGGTDQPAISFKFSQLAKVEIRELSSWVLGKFYHIQMWRNDIGQVDMPLEHRLPTHLLAFKPIALEAALEIERRFDEYIANNKGK